MKLSPKEEAKELVDKYQSCEINFLEYAWVCPKGAKKLALIAVDAILKVAFYASDEIYNHYLEVKQEIELL